MGKKPREYFYAYFIRSAILLYIGYVDALCTGTLCVRV